MAHSPPLTEPAESRLPEPARPPLADVPDLPGCESFPLAVDEIERHDDRIEYWDARAGMAWRVRDVSSWHEQPGQRLAMLAARMASVRGAAVECFGSTSLRRRGASYYLRPCRKVILAQTAVQWTGGGVTLAAARQP